MLLLKKKKYAAVKMHFKDGTSYEVAFYEVFCFVHLECPVFCCIIQLLLIQVIERKGLDMVRRDWSLLSKELGDFCLSQILSGGSVAFACLGQECEFAYLVVSEADWLYACF